MGEDDERRPIRLRMVRIRAMKAKEKAAAAGG